MATQEADHVVVVTTTDVTALRDAQRTVMELDRFPTDKVHLVVNRVAKKLMRQLHTTIDDAMDAAGLPLLGVVPEDPDIPRCLNQGVPCGMTISMPPGPTIILPNASRAERPR